MTKTYILLIGGAGFIGSNLIRSLLLRQDSQWEVYVLEPAFAELSRLDGMDIHVINGDLSNIDFVKSLIEVNHISVVVHLVSNIIPGSSFEDYKREYQQVIFPSIDLMEYCAQKDIKFVYFSSGGTVYGNRSNTAPFNETDEMAPISYYGWSKQMMENSILYVHRTAGLRYLTLRPSNPYGHGQNMNAGQGLVAVALGRILTGKPVVVWGDGSNVRDYIYIDDLCHAVAILLEKDVCNTTINIGSGTGTSVNALIDIIKEVVEETVKVEYVPARNVDVSHMVLDTTRLQQYANFSITSLREGVSMFYREVKSRLQKSE